MAADAAALPFRSASFDVVISSECIEHTARPEASVAEMLRVLRPGGLLVLTCPNSVWRWSVAVANALHLRAYQGLEHWPGWWTLDRWVQVHGGDRGPARGFPLFPVRANAHPPVAATARWLRRRTRPPLCQSRSRRGKGQVAFLPAARASRVDPMGRVEERLEPQTTRVTRIRWLLGANAAELSHVDGLTASSRWPT